VLKYVILATLLYKYIIVDDSLWFHHILYISVGMSIIYAIYVKI